jgi:hypothetical protein
MEKEYKAMMEQVRREGEMMKGRAMINTKVHFCDFFPIISQADITSPYSNHYKCDLYIVMNRPSSSDYSDNDKSEEVAYIANLRYFI